MVWIENFRSHFHFPLASSRFLVLKTKQTIKQDFGDSSVSEVLSTWIEYLSLILGNHRHVQPHMCVFSPHTYMDTLTDTHKAKHIHARKLGFQIPSIQNGFPDSQFLGWVGWRLGSDNSCGISEGGLLFWGREPGVGFDTFPLKCLSDIQVKNLTLIVG